MNISSNIRKLTLVFVALFMALSGGLVYWQTIVAKEVTTIPPSTNRHCLPENTPMRGRIFDRNGKLLAWSVPDNNVCGGFRRQYADASLAGLIGYYAGPNFLSTGIEHQFDSYLTGQVGMTALNNTVNKVMHRQQMGNDIYLTIDERIQKIASQDFDAPVNVDNVNNFASNRGSIIVSNPKTGEILAMVSRPSFDPNMLVSTLLKGHLDYYNQLLHDPEQPLLERPLETFIPGSVYKTVTLMAGLESGSTTLDQKFDRQHSLGPIFINGEPIGPVGNNIDGYTFRFPVTTEYGYAHSDNVIYAQIGTETGADKWMEMNKQFYVGGTIPFDMPVPTSTVTKNGQPLEENQLADDAFGQGFDNITPLQMALVDNTAANNGGLMRPALIEKIVDTNNNPIQQFTQQTLSNPISQQTATQVRRAMYGVVACGSGFLYTPMQSSPWGIIGKTGTAQVGGNLPAHAWLITEAPYSVNNPDQLPALTIVAMKENAGDGATGAGPMTTQIYNDVFSQGIVQAQPPVAPNRAQYCAQTGLLQ